MKMKKIMFGLVAAIATVAAQAAYVDWQYDGKGTADWGTSKTEAANGYTAYLLTAANWDSIKENVKDESTIAGKATDSSTLIFEKSDKSGNKYYTTHADGSTGAGARQKEAESGNYYVILANDDGYTVVVDNVSVTAYSDISAGGTGQTANLVAQGQSTASVVSGAKSYGGGSGGEGVPEPTSGLLLLVGGAMLALRRKQK